METRSGRIDRAMKHYIIAARMGCDLSIRNVRLLYDRGGEEDFAAALRAHKAAVDATKRPQMEAADAAQF
eukprot:scaffold786_cov91-Skeletonema_dohrnii-CCMP3373.AAC.2